MTPADVADAAVLAVPVGAEVLVEVAAYALVAEAEVAYVLVAVADNDNASVRQNQWVHMDGLAVVVVEYNASYEIPVSPNSNLCIQLQQKSQPS